MGKLYIPAEKEIKGPWLIGIEELEELDTIIKEIEILLNESYNKEINQDVLEKSERSEETTESIIKKVKSSFLKEIKRSFVLISKDNSRIIDNSIRDLLKDSKVKSFSPKELNISIEYGYKIRFTFEITKRYYGRLNYQSRCFDTDIQDEISYKIETWIDRNKPNKVKQFWNEFSFPIFMLTMLILIFSSTNIITTVIPSSKEVYQVQVDSLIKNGVTQENQNKAIELILKYNSNYIPVNVKEITKYNTNAIKLSIMALIFSLIAYFNPKTTIGLGKQKKMLSFYKIYIKLILVTIPAIFIIPPIIEWLKGLI